MVSQIVNKAFERTSKQERLIIGILFLFGLCLRIYMATVDPMLHEWDEKYHALVAKNMILNPFKPMLYTHQSFPTDIYNWTNNHIWLHKQPLFLWQMAASMKLLGVSEFAMRAPSVIMGTLMPLFLYRMAKLLFASRLAGCFAALLMATNNYSLNLISGREGMDHNDIAFCFYVTASFWAYSEFLNEKTLKWVIITGIFAGCAVLNKWLSGIIVFAPWGIIALTEAVRNRTLKPLYSISISVLVCLIIFLPWQIYILTRFPDIANHEYSYNTKHIWESLEGHSGDIWYYLNFFPDYFGWQINYLVPLGLIILVVQKNSSLPSKTLLIAAPIIVFCFFSFVVQTKVKGYFYSVVPLCILLSGYALCVITHMLRNYSGLGIIVFSAVCTYYSLNFNQIENYTKEVSYRSSKIHNTNIYKQLDQIVPKNINIIINANNQEHVDIMFYSKRLEAYHTQISYEDFMKIASKGIPIAAFKSRENHILPEYILNYRHTYIIDSKIM